MASILQKPFKGVDFKTMEKTQFKAESKRLLDLMINSIYTNKEIFLRELISNASDAIDKLYYRSLTKKDVTLNQSSLEIDLKLDKENKNIIIKDNGCGMTEKELEENLGTIAKSGSLKFKEENEKKEEALLYAADLFKILGDSTRIKILSVLMDNELNVSQICESINLNTSAVSHQLRILRQSYLVKSRRVGKEIYYSLDDEHVSIIINIALEHINEKKW